jgi:hypothetical protein
VKPARGLDRSAAAVMIAALPSSEVDYLILALGMGDHMHEVQRRMDDLHGAHSSVALGISYLLSAIIQGSELVPASCRHLILRVTFEGVDPL